MINKHDAALGPCSQKLIFLIDIDVNKAIIYINVDNSLDKVTMQKQRIEPLVAWRALRRLIADPEQTHEVFTVIRALSGNSMQREFEQFCATETGRTILREQRSLLDTLKNREYLASLPANSLGRHYLSFVTSEGITAEGLVEASDEDGEYQYLEGDISLFAMRQRDQHDLWHTLTQYGRDELGEDCLLAFTYAQTKNRGIGVICLAGALKLRAFYGNGIFGAVWRAYKDGKRAAWLPAQDWEALLAQPIDEVRQQLGLTEPESYQELFAQPA